MNENFYKRWNNKKVEDCGNYVSKEYNTWQNALKKSLSKTAEDFGGRLIWFSKGHYHESCCLYIYNKYIYISKDANRNGLGECTIDLDDKGCFNGFLIRTMKDEKDYTGGTNNYCNYKSIEESIKYLLQ